MYVAAVLEITFSVCSRYLLPGIYGSSKTNIPAYMPYLTL